MAVKPVIWKLSYLFSSQMTKLREEK